MSDDNVKIASFDGQQVNWKKWKKQRNGFKKLHSKFFGKGYIGIPDPSKRDRITEEYVVADNQENDPTGAASGDTVRIEQPAQYSKKCKDWTETDEKWYHLQYNALDGKALELADDMDSENGRELEAILDNFYDKTTSV